MARQSVCHWVRRGRGWAGLARMLAVFKSVGPSSFSLLSHLAKATTWALTREALSLVHHYLFPSTGQSVSNQTWPSSPTSVTSVTSKELLFLQFCDKSKTWGLIWLLLLPFFPPLSLFSFSPDATVAVCSVSLGMLLVSVGVISPPRPDNQHVVVTYKLPWQDKSWEALIQGDTGLWDIILGGILRDNLKKNFSTEASRCFAFSSWIPVSNKPPPSLPRPVKGHTAC